MFSFIARNRLKNMVLKAIGVCSHQYEFNLQKYLEKSSKDILDFDTYREKMFALEDGKIEQDFQNLANEYYTRVASYVFSYVKSISAKASAAIYAVTQNPNSCGYYIESIESPMAGAVYAISFYALTNKIARQKDCEMLNQLQQYMMICISQKIYDECQ